MISEKQLEANKRNARKSTGARTRAGKSRSSKNATRHGLLSSEIVPGILSTREINKFRKETIADMAPQGACQWIVANQFVESALWLFIVRRFKAELLKAAVKLKRLDIERQRQNFLDRTRGDEMSVQEKCKEVAKLLSESWKADMAKPPTFKEFEYHLWEQLSAREGVDALLDRYEVKYERSMYKALEEFRKLQAAGGGRQNRRRSAAGTGGSEPENN